MLGTARRRALPPRPMSGPSITQLPRARSPVDSAETDLLIEASEATLLAGRAEDALDLARRVTGTATSDRVRGLTALAWAAWWSAHYAVAERTIAEGLALADGTDTAAEVALRVLHARYLNRVAWDPARAIIEAKRAVALADVLEAHRAEAYGALGAACTSNGDPAWRTWLERSIAAARDEGAFAVESSSADTLFFAELMAGDAGQCPGLAEDLVDRARMEGAVTTERQFRKNLLLARFHVLGRLAEIVEDAWALLRLPLNDRRARSRRESPRTRARRRRRRRRSGAGAPVGVRLRRARSNVARNHLVGEGGGGLRSWSLCRCAGRGRRVPHTSGTRIPCPCHGRAGAAVGGHGARAGPRRCDDRRHLSQSRGSKARVGGDRGDARLALGAIPRRELSRRRERVGTCVTARRIAVSLGGRRGCAACRSAHRGDRVVAAARSGASDAGATTAPAPCAANDASGGRTRTAVGRAAHRTADAGRGRRARPRRARPRHQAHRRAPLDSGIHRRRAHSNGGCEARRTDSPGGGHQDAAPARRPANRPRTTRRRGTGGGDRCCVRDVRKGSNGTRTRRSPTRAVATVVRRRRTRDAALRRRRAAHAARRHARSIAGRRGRR